VYKLLEEIVLITGAASFLTESNFLYTIVYRIVHMLNWRQKKKNYINARFPQIVPTEINFEKVQTQPDGTCCGVYTAAFATDIVLGRNPCKEKYSTDVDSMRHFF